VTALTLRPPPSVQNPAKGAVIQKIIEHHNLAGLKGKTRSVSRTRGHRSAIKLAPHFPHIRYEIPRVLGCNLQAKGCPPYFGRCFSLKNTHARKGQPFAISSSDIRTSSNRHLKEVQGAAKARGTKLGNLNAPNAPRRSAGLMIGWKAQGKGLGEITRELNPQHPHPARKTVVPQHREGTYCSQLKLQRLLKSVRTFHP